MTQEDDIIRDGRFQGIQRDPRFRRPRRRDTKTVIDRRFAHMMDHKDFEVIRALILLIILILCYLNLYSYYMR